MCFSLFNVAKNFLYYGCFCYVSESWSIMESSPEPGGIPAVFLLKTLIPAMALLLALQAVSLIIQGLIELSEVPTDG